MDVSDADTVRRRRKRKVVLDYLDDLDPPSRIKSKKSDSMALHQKVSAMEERRSQILGQEAPSVKPEKEDLPAVVFGDDVLAETDLRSPDVRVRCRSAIASYDQLQLHLLFDTTEENCLFRLHLYAIAHGLGPWWPQNDVHTRVLKRVLELSAPQRSRSPVSEKTEKPVERKLKNGVVVVTEKIEVPGRVLKLINGIL